MQSDLEWKTRVDLAACYRLVEHYGMCDLHLNHISARVPGDKEHFLINAFGLMYEEITASSLIKVDLDGNVISNADSNYSINLPGYVIHSAIHSARPDVGCVLHTHTVAGVAVSSLKCGLLQNSQTALRWGRIAYHDFQGVAVNLAERKSLVDDLGNSEIMILRNHGLVAVGGTVAQAFSNIFRLERACQIQLAMMACNTELVKIKDSVRDLTIRELSASPTLDARGVRQPQGEIEWPALKRMLDRRNPSYKS